MKRSEVNEVLQGRENSPKVYAEKASVSEGGKYASGRFRPSLGRFSKIEEDEPPCQLLCAEYPKAK